MLPQCFNPCMFHTTPTMTSALAKPDYPWPSASTEVLHFVRLNTLFHNPFHGYLHLLPLLTQVLGLEFFGKGGNFPMASSALQIFKNNKVGSKTRRCNIYILMTT